MADIEQKEAFVSGLTGTTRLEVTFITACSNAHLLMPMIAGCMQAGALFDNGSPCNNRLVARRLVFDWCCSRCYKPGHAIWPRAAVYSTAIGKLIVAKQQLHMCCPRLRTV